MNTNTQNPRAGEQAQHTATPWIVDDRHIHCALGLTYPRGVEPETDVIVQVDTDCHARGLLNATDKANLAFIVRACNAHEDMQSALAGVLASLDSLCDAVFDRCIESEHLIDPRRADRIAAARALLARIQEGQP